MPFFNRKHQLPSWEKSAQMRDMSELVIDGHRIGVLFSEDEIAARVKVIASEIAARKPTNLLVVPVLKGSFAGTLTAAAEILQKHGARRVFAGVSHAILGDLAHERLRDSVIEEVITTDSVPQAAGDKVQIVGIAPLLGEAIRRISGGQSVTSLFEV